jgi:hypothetical protein
MGEGVGRDVVSRQTSEGLKSTNIWEKYEVCLVRVLSRRHSISKGPEAGETGTFSEHREGQCGWSEVRAL